MRSKYKNHKIFGFKMIIFLFLFLLFFYWEIDQLLLIILNGTKDGQRTNYLSIIPISWHLIRSIQQNKLSFISLISYHQSNNQYFFSSLSVSKSFKFKRILQFLDQ